MSAVPRNDVIAFVAGSLAGESPLSIEDAVGAALRLVDEFDDHGWSIRAGDPRVEHDLAANEIRVEFGGVDLTPAFVAVGGVRYDLVATPDALYAPKCPDASEVIAGAVAATLDYVSGWNADEDNVADYQARAEQVRTYAEVGWRESACCPVCAEVVCDDDCPLYLVRDAAGVWVGSSGALAAELADRFEERESAAGDEGPLDPLPEEAYAPDATALLSLAVEEPEVDDEEIETINDTMVSATMSDPPRISWLGAAPGVSVEMALRHAAWVVALADPLDERFPAILRAVRST